MGSFSARPAVGLVILSVLTMAAIAMSHTLLGVIAALALGTAAALLLVATTREVWRGRQTADAAAGALEAEQVANAAIRGQLNALLASFAEAVILVSSTGQIEVTNPAAERLGVARGQPLAAAPEWVRSAMAAHAANDGDVLRVPSGTDGERLVATRVVPVTGAEQDPGVVVLLTDVTESRRAGEARAKLLSSLSHDLKTPMTSIQMSIHLLLEDAGGRLSTRQLEFLEAARDDAQKLHVLIEEMVGAARGRS